MTIWSSDLGWLEYLMSQLCSSMDGEMLSTGSLGVFEDQIVII